MTNLEDLQKMRSNLPHRYSDPRYMLEILDKIYAILQDYETRIAALESA